MTKSSPSWLSDLARLKYPDPTDTTPRGTLAPDADYDEYVLSSREERAIARTAMFGGLTLIAALYAAFSFGLLDRF